MKRQKDMEWSRLDNASKMFPATWSPRDPKVFRFSCELYEEVVPGILQKALEITLNDFPLYKSVLKRGIFWYYLESSDIPAEVQPESTHVCAPVYVGLKSNLLFRVSYFKCRINLEVFHVLSDGAGAIRFMRFLIYYYLTLLHPDKYSGQTLENDASSISEQMDDSYKKHYVGGKALRRMVKEEKKQVKVNAYKIHGTRTAENRMTLIEGSMSAQAVLNEAHKYNTTLTVFISALLIYSIYKAMPGGRSDKPIVLTVPVNLRQFFKSVTSRNFFSTVNVGYKFEKDDDLKRVIESVGESLKKHLTVEQLNYQLCKFISFERNPFARVVPLPLKDFVIRLAAKSYARYATSSISNVGKIVMPADFSSDICEFSVCTSVRKPQITLCSFNDKMVISITSPYKEMEIQRIFFQMLAAMGIRVEISSNL